MTETPARSSEMEKVSKSYDGVQASGPPISGVPLQIHVLLGENGAGKSTIHEDPRRCRPARQGTIRITGEMVRDPS